MLKGQGKLWRREALFFFPTRLQRENTMIIIDVTIRYTLPTRLRTANAVIIFNVTIRYVLPTRLQSNYPEGVNVPVTVFALKV